MKKTLVYSLFMCLFGVVLGGSIAYIVHLATMSEDLSKTSNEVFSSKNDTNSPIDSDSQINEYSLVDSRKIEQHLQEFDDLTLVEDSADQRKLIYSYVSQIPNQELEHYLRHTIEKSFSVGELVQFKLQQAMLEKLSIFNPKGALDIALAISPAPQSSALSMRMSIDFAVFPAQPPKMTLIETVFKVWASNDLPSAVAQGKTLADSTKRFALAGILASQEHQSLDQLRGIALAMGSSQEAVNAYIASFNIEHLDDPRSAWYEVSRLAARFNLHHEWTLKNVLVQWYEQHGANIVDEIQTSTISSNLKSAMTLLVLKRALSDDPKLAFKLALKSDSPTIVNEVIRSWSEIDPQAAYNILEDIEDAFYRKLLTRTVFDIWAKRDPHYILENIDLFPSEFHRYALASSLGAIAVSAPVEAAELAMSLRNTNAREHAMNRVLRVWMRQDLESAINFVEQVDTTDKQRFELVSSLSEWLLSEDPHRAFELARNETTLSRHQTGLEADVVGTIAQWDNLETAVELLAQVREGKTRAVASANVAEQLIIRGRIKEARDLGLNLPATEQQVYFPLIVDEWSRIDPQGLVDYIERLPTARLRSRVALSLFGEYVVDNFNEAQLDQLKEYLDAEDLQMLND